MKKKKFILEMQHVGEFIRINFMLMYHVPDQLGNCSYYRFAGAWTLSFYYVSKTRFVITLKFFIEIQHLMWI